jgi:hypothetical protein
VTKPFFHLMNSNCVSSLQETEEDLPPALSWESISSASSEPEETFEIRKSTDCGEIEEFSICRKVSPSQIGSSKKVVGRGQGMYFVPMCLYSAVLYLKWVTGFVLAIAVSCFMCIARPCRFVVVVIGYWVVTANAWPLRSTPQYAVH